MATITYQGEIHTDATENGKNAYELSRAFILLSKDATAYQILQHNSIPKINAVHPENPSFRCQKRSTSHETDAKGDKWIVTCDYFGSYGGGGGEDGGIDTDIVYAWKLPAYDISFTTAEYERPMEWAYEAEKTVKDGILSLTPVAGPIQVRNTAKDLYTNPISTIPVLTTIVTFSQNVKSFNMDNIILFKNTINNNSFTFFGMSISPYQAKIRDISASYVEILNESGLSIDQNASYYKVDYSIEIANSSYINVYDNEEWVQSHQFAVVIQNYGFSALDDDGNKYRIKIKDGVYGKFEGDTQASEVTEAVPLDENGKVIQQGGYPENSFYFINEPMDWTPLDLPSKEPKNL